MATQASIDRVQQMYIAYYGRPADPAGLEYWADRLDAAGGSLESIVSQFGTSQEFMDRYGELSFEALVNNLYQQAFDRDAETEGLAFYTERLASGEATLGDIAVQILDGAQNGDLAIITNKLTVASAFTQKVEDENLDYNGNDAAETAKTLLSEVTADASSVDAVLAQVDTLADVLPPIEEGPGTGPLVPPGDNGNGDDEPADPIVVSLDIQAASEDTDTASSDVEVGTLSATNIDEPVYTIVSGNDAGVFQINGNKLEIKQGAVLDHETAGSFNLAIAASDGTSAGQNLITVTIEDADEAPTGMTLSAAQAAEEAGTVAIGTIAVADEDDPATSFGDYSYVTDDARFQVDDDTGVLSFVPGNGDLDFETEPAVTFNVVATSGSGQMINRDFIITVTDSNDEPTAISLSANDTDENTTGVTIGVVRWPMWMPWLRSKPIPTSLMMRVSPWITPAAH